MNSIYRFLTKRNQAVVLMYHRVIEANEGNAFSVQPGMYVTSRVFERQMRYLFKRYKVVSLEEFIQDVKIGMGFSRNTCMLTFDDGWKDTYSQAFPVLRKYRLPATVFIVSDYVNTIKRFWTERVYYLLARYIQDWAPKQSLKAGDPPLRPREIFGPLIHRGVTSAEEIEMILETLKRLDRTEREKAIHELETLVEDHKVDESAKPVLLSWPEIIEMNQARITFGSHTKTHAILPQLSSVEAEKEIVESKQAIEGRMTTHCWAFCYPNGDYDDEIQRVVGKHYSCAFTTQEGFVRSDDDLYQLKRIGIHNDVTSTIPLFACKLSGLLS